MVIHDISKQIEERVHIGKIFTHWHLQQVVIPKTSIES